MRPCVAPEAAAVGIRDELTLTFNFSMLFGMSTLARLSLRRSARIQRVGGERAFRRRLLELGFLPGVEVRVLGVAPMGDPLDIEIRGCRFSLRRAEADAVDVLEEVVEAAVAAK